MEGLYNAVIIFRVVLFYASFSSSEESSSLVTKTTLTTAKVRGSVSPKPTSLNRRINVEPVQEFSSRPSDLFRAKGPQRRSRMDTVWEWDFSCQLQPKTGKCSGTAKRQGPMTQNYYYDAQLDACKMFIFYGCDGNKNNFQSLLECERHCKGSIYMTLKDTTKKTYCGLQPNAGICMALIQRYYYDVKADDCKTFVYGGCGGNQNRFETHEQCDKRCKGVKYNKIKYSIFLYP